MISNRLPGSALVRRSFSAGGSRRRATRLRLPFAAAAVALAVFAGHTIEQRLSARTALAEGEEAFGRGDFVRAADRFHSALEINPASTAVRLRLVTAYQMQFVPGGDSLANHDAAKRALEEIARVLDRDPSNRAAMIAAAEIHDGRSDYDQARHWYGRLAAIDSSNAAAFAGMSASSLTQVSAAVLDARSRAGLAAFALPPRRFALRQTSRASAPKAAFAQNDDLRRSLAERWSASIAEGIDAASKALTIDRGHEGAMLTLDAWHQLAADLAASPDEYRRHTISASEWRHKALDARRQKAVQGSQ
jgi:tetratricopeptide (TPR) repeat protein